VRDIYEDDIVNPYTGGKMLYVMNRTRTYLKNSDASVTRGLGVDCIVVDDYMTQLKKLDTSEVTYCVNPESKGMVIAIWLIDGVYIYEIDENGQKINESSISLKRNKNKTKLHVSNTYGGEIEMKRIARILTLALIVTFLLTLPISAVELPIRVVVNGTKINFPDAEPFIDENSRTQVPIRFVGEALGADVSWDGNTKKVTITLNGKKVVLQIGNKNYEVNGQQKQMDTVALLKESRTFVPVRFVSEALGATVKWNANIRTVYIDMNGDVAPSPEPTGGTVKYYDGIAFNDVTGC